MPNYIFNDLKLWNLYTIKNKIRVPEQIILRIMRMQEIEKELKEIQPKSRRNRKRVKSRSVLPRN
jgi:hypothetical protein